MPGPTAFIALVQEMIKTMNHDMAKSWSMNAAKYSTIFSFTTLIATEKFVAIDCDVENNDKVYR